MSKLILGSGSPRRKELLGELGFEFEVVPSAAEELHDASMDLRDLCEENARLKAADVAKNHPEDLVLGSDTLVFIDQTPLGKPKSQAEAVETLKMLSGREHSVCTGVCLIQGDRVKVFSEVTQVKFKSLDEETIADYMGKVNVMDKAGSYAIQEQGEMIIEGIVGDLSNVIGLPQQKVLDEIAHFGLQPAAH